MAKKTTRTRKAEDTERTWNFKIASDKAIINGQRYAFGNVVSLTKTEAMKNQDGDVRLSLADPDQQADYDEWEDAAVEAEPEPASGPTE